MRDIPGTVFFDGPMATKGYPLNKLLYSLNSEAGRRAFVEGEEACYDRFGLSEEQCDALRRRDVLAMLRAGGSIYYLAKLGSVLGLGVQDIGGLQTGRTTEEFQSYLDSQGVGKHHG